MITAKEDAIIEVKKAQPDYKNIDKILLKDKDVVRAYMQAHSSNRLLDLNSKFCINLDINGLINDEDFMIDVINNLDIGYNQDDLVYLIELSTMRIIQTNYDDYKHMPKEELENLASAILKRYHNIAVSKKLELSAKKQVIDEVFDFIHSTRILDDLKSNDEKIIIMLHQIFDIFANHVSLSTDEQSHVDDCMGEITKLLRQQKEHRENFEKYVRDEVENQKTSNDRYARHEIGFK